MRPRHRLRPEMLSMSLMPLVWLRRLLIVGCLVALIPSLARLGDVADALRRDRLAAAAHVQGERLRAAGRLTEAVQAFRAAVEYAPSTPDLYETLAYTQFRMGRIDDAIATYREILQVYPYSYFPTLYRGVGLIELQAGRLQAARNDLSKAVTLDPNDWLAHHLLGLALERSGDIEGARGAWTRVLELRPDFEPAKERLKELDAKAHD